MGLTDKQRKAIFFSSDWHLFHANCLKFDNRPFSSIEAMHDALVRRYNAVVPQDGVCYFLGDIGVSGGTEGCFSVISRLNGTKVLVLGNHDKKMHAMYKAGFDVVLHAASMVIQGEMVTMTHCPLRGLYREDVTGMKGSIEGQNWHGEHKQKDFSIESFGQFHLHGHIHSPNGGKSQKTLGRQMDVGAPAWNYTPVSISQVESWISKVKADEAASGK